MCIIYSSYIQHLTNKHKERQTTEKSTVGSEAQRRWELFFSFLFECKWVPMSAPHARKVLLQTTPAAPAGGPPPPGEAEVAFKKKEEEEEAFFSG